VEPAGVIAGGEQQRSCCFRPTPKLSISCGEAWAVSRSSWASSAAISRVSRRIGGFVDLATGDSCRGVSRMRGRHNSVEFGTCTRRFRVQLPPRFSGRGWWLGYLTENVEGVTLSGPFIGRSRGEA
jgi:hypothetical protein